MACAMNKTHGFSLLEAIVALAILAAAGLAPFASMSQSLQMVNRAERAREVDSALLNAVAWMDTVNPMERPQGEQSFGEFTLQWQSEPIESVRDGVTGFRQPGLYQVGLYRVRLELMRDGVLERGETLRRVGYKQVRQPAVL